jgi:predicted nucleic acid-binding protein
LVGGYGAKNKEKELEIRLNLLRKFLILPFDFETAKISAKIEADLLGKGKFIGRSDVIIAGSMIKHGIDTIVTRNVKHFEEIPGIKVQTWKG